MLKSFLFIFVLVFAFMALYSPELHALPDVASSDNLGIEPLLSGLGAKSRKTIKRSIKKLGVLKDPRILPALEALRDRRLRVDKNGDVFILEDVKKDTAQNIITGETGSVKELKLRTPIINNAIRRVLSPSIAQIQLQSPDSNVRLAAAEELNKRPQEDAVGLVKNALAKESDSRIRDVLLLTLAQIDFNSNDAERRLEAIAAIGDSGNINFKFMLQELLEKGDDGNFKEPDDDVRKAATTAILKIERNQFFISQTANLFYGLSLGSVLLLAALGLAITFGLLGVINMAHGEMLMLGAYATYVTQNLFQAYLPSLFDWYLLAAIPIAFAVSALVGVLLERTIICHLYGRPLETLLATWGISLVLIQSVRLIFGAQNVEVANPSWLSGGVEIMQGVVFPYSRITIIFFAIFVVALVWGLLQRTRLGLHVRAVIQNRSMASCLGISTPKVDMLTFGLGSGVAGLGGVALSQIGNVGPELGQTYIVDCFMVVVLGGVGKIAGTVAGAMGIGIVNKFLEPVSGAVFGKIIVLLFIILFIQKRPQGIFALKGRVAEN